MPHSERQIQMGTSMTREMAQEMNAGRMMSVASHGLARAIGMVQIGKPYPIGPVEKLWAFSTRRRHALAIGPNCGQRMPV